MSINDISHADARPVVFLDIDDVLCVHEIINTDEILAVLSERNGISSGEIWDQIFNLAARQNLRQLHDEFIPNYVISSSWALHLSREHLCEVFKRTGLAFVHDNLHDTWCTPRDNESYRLTEIEGWLESQVDATLRAVLILDDELSGQSLVGSHLESRAVFCEASLGFMSAELATARKILRHQSEALGLKVD